MVKFSVVVPVYKTERYLVRCLDSLAAQTEDDWEVIIVDDCSPGDAAGSSNPPYQAEAIVAKYNARFRYIRHERNRGAFQARYTGVKAAKGDWIVPVDPDDYLLSETLAKLREVIARDEPDMVSYRMEYDNGAKTWDHWCHHPNATMPATDALRELTEHKYFTGVASKAFRRETLVAALQALDAPDDLYLNTCDDFLMLVPMLLKSAKVSFLDHAGYRYFTNEQSTSYTWQSRAGFRRACDQMRTANALIERMADREQLAPEVRALVTSATQGIEDWFAQMRKESSLPHRATRFLRKLLGK